MCEVLEMCVGTNFLLCASSQVQGFTLGSTVPLFVISNRKETRNFRLVI